MSSLMIQVPTWMYSSSIYPNRYDTCSPILSICTVFNPNQVYPSLPRASSVQASSTSYTIANTLSSFYCLFNHTLSTFSPFRIFLSRSNYLQSPDKPVNTTYLLLQSSLVFSSSWTNPLTSTIYPLSSFPLLFRAATLDYFSMNRIEQFQLSSLYSSFINTFSIFPNCSKNSFISDSVSKRFRLYTFTVLYFKSIIYLALRPCLYS